MSFLACDFADLLVSQDDICVLVERFNELLSRLETMCQDVNALVARPLCIRQGSQPSDVAWDLAWVAAGGSLPRPTNQWLIWIEEGSGPPELMHLFLDPSCDVPDLGPREVFTGSSVEPVVQELHWLFEGYSVDGWPGETWHGIPGMEALTIELPATASFWNVRVQIHWGSLADHSYTRATLDGVPTSSTRLLESNGIHFGEFTNVAPGVHTLRAEVYWTPSGSAEVLDPRMVADAYPTP